MRSDFAMRMSREVVDTIIEPVVVAASGDGMMLLR
jgi:hypothetical protein